jgi:hypothetical protein
VVDLPSLIWNCQSKAMELMISEVVLAASEALGLVTTLSDPRRFVTLRDDILNQIEHWPAGYQGPGAAGLERAQELIRRIRRRQIYKLVASTAVPPATVGSRFSVTPEDILKHVVRCVSSGPIRHLFF